MQCPSARSVVIAVVSQHYNDQRDTTAFKHCRFQIGRCFFVDIIADFDSVALNDTRPRTNLDVLQLRGAEMASFQSLQ